jgi:hypothetical protein
MGGRRRETVWREDEKEEDVMVNMGNAGDSSTMVRVYCDLMGIGFCLVRKGWREGLPRNVPPIWVFCPLKAGQNPRDRELVVNCEKCKHYKGCSHSAGRTEQKDTTSFKVTMHKPFEKPPRKTVGKEEIENAAEEKKKRDEEWLKDPKKGKKSAGKMETTAKLKILEESKFKPCFGGYYVFNDNCDRCQLDKTCKKWKCNMLNFKHKKNVLNLLLFILLAAWNFKIGLDFLTANLTLFAVPSFLVVLLFFVALGSSIKFRKKVMKAYQSHL